MQNPRPLLELVDVHVDHYGARMLRGVTWTLCDGEHWAILGTNGAGKSSLMRLIKGELWPHHDNGGRRVYHIDEETTESSVTARHRIALVSAEAQEAYRRHRWSMQGLHVLLTGYTGRVWFQGEPTATQLSQARNVAHTLDLSHLLEQDILTMSTGQARRFLLGRALLSKPRILLLDEYLNGLDRHSRSVISEVIHETAAQGTSVLMSSHRAEEFPPFLTHFARMESGRITEVGECPIPHSQPHEFTPVSRHYPVNASDPLVEVCYADVIIKGKKILYQINFSVNPGDYWLLTGENGSGKSTFMRLLTGEQPPYYGGEVRWLGRSQGWTSEERHSLFGIVSASIQEWQTLDTPMINVVVSGFYGTADLHGRPVTPGWWTAAREMLAHVGLSDRAATPFGALSHGERRRVLLARALVHRPAILLLDEPCNGLDAESRSIFIDMIRDSHAAGAAVIHATHHPEEAPAAHFHEIIMRDGRLLIPPQGKELECATQAAKDIAHDRQ